MNIQGINPALTQQTSQAQGKSSLGQQEFLQLLVAQMRNQDPVNPMDGAEFASQLAQFNSVEQLISVNDGLDQLAMSQDLMGSSLTNSMAASLTGKDIRALSDQVFLSSEGEAEINFKLNDSASDVEIIVRTASGAEVRRESLSGIPSGDSAWTWDGLNNNGERMGEDDYTVEVVAKNGDNNVGALTFIEGFASKVRYTSQGVYLSVNGIDIPIGDVEEVGTSPNSDD
jgi:flagellar basal-body rod modification protein FlgD